MSDQPTTQETPRRFKSKTAAMVALRKDSDAFHAAHAETVAAYWRDLRNALRLSLPDWLFEVADLHLPHVFDNVGSYFSAYCPACSGCCDSEDAPCNTLTLILDQTMPGREPMPSRTAGAFPKTLADYWPDPCVIVTFAYQTLLTDKETGKHWLLEPGTQHTLKHSLAYELRTRLVTTSRERVEAMA